MAKEFPTARLRGLARHGQRWIPALAWLLVLTFAAWAASDLFWRFTRPAPVAALPTGESDPLKAARLLSGRNPFGASDGPVLASAPRAAAPAFRLVGVATGFGQDVGFALLQAGNEPPMAVLEGESPAPGMTLRRILPDRVELESPAGIQELPLQEPQPSTAMDAAREQLSGGKLHPSAKFGRPGQIGRTVRE